MEGKWWRLPSEHARKLTEQEYEDTLARERIIIVFLFFFLLILVSVIGYYGAKSGWLDTIINIHRGGVL